jgi:hypothetical protein
MDRIMGNDEGSLHMRIALTNEIPELVNINASGQVLWKMSELEDYERKNLVIVAVENSKLAGYLCFNRMSHKIERLAIADATKSFPVTDILFKHVLEYVYRFASMQRNQAPISINEDIPLAEGIEEKHGFNSRQHKVDPNVFLRLGRRTQIDCALNGLERIAGCKFILCTLNDKHELHRVPPGHSYINSSGETIDLGWSSKHLEDNQLPLFACTESPILTVGDPCSKINRVLQELGMRSDAISRQSSDMGQHLCVPLPSDAQGMLPFFNLRNKDRGICQLTHAFAEKLTNYPRTQGWTL